MMIREKYLHGRPETIPAIFIFFLVCTLVQGATDLLNGTLQWRFVGPYRGGRVTTVTGVEGRPRIYYLGATGGGVWKTEDAGITWSCVSDGFFKTGSIGAIAVAPSDPNVVYAGTGEACLRNNLSSGDGVYRTVDAGRTWVNIGLKDSAQIGQIRVDPRDPNRVYVAAVGHPFGPSEQRGIFRSKDGGKSWEKILYVDENTGGVDLALDPSNPRIIYAAMWQVRRKPWGIFSGGPGSGLYKSTDAGDSWSRLSNGLPGGSMGRIGVAVSPVNPSRVWALVEAEQGGVYRSDDGGASWRLMNDGIQVRRRPYYYTHIIADTQDLNTVYVMSSPFLKSIDGGKTFQRMRTPHGDEHALWVAPEDHNRMINGNDGGANISFDGGKSWTKQDNQPTGQFYAVITDNQFPYRIYGAQQDSSTVSIASRTSSFGIDRTDWYSVGGGESGYIAPDPRDPNIVYAGSFWGVLTRYDHRTGQTRNIQVWPDPPAGEPGSKLKYRFQWTFPIILSPHNPDVMYVGANVVFKSEDQGQSWQVISPDLTRDDKEKEKHDRLASIYCTLSTLAESPLQKGVIWAGSDDGLVHVTRDGGKRWTDVTPAEMKPWTRVNLIEASPFSAGTAYVAAFRFQLDDSTPLLYKTTDFGKTWNLISRNILRGAFVRSVREDPRRRGLLFAATEKGVFYSPDDGQSWEDLNLNLPAVPVTDIRLKDSDVVISTQGRGFWVLDNITPLEQMTPEVASSGVHLFAPRAAYRMGRSRRWPAGQMGQNPPRGATIDFFLKSVPSGALKLEILDDRGHTVKTFSSAAQAPPGGLSVHAGVNRFIWDMRYPDAHGIKGGTHLFGGSLRGPVAVPGKYQLRLSVGSSTQTQSLEIRKDPRLSSTQADFQKQFDLLTQIDARLSTTHDAVNRILEIRPQLKEAEKRADEAGSPLRSNIASVGRDLDEVLQELVELRFTGVDDQMLLYPVKLNVRLAYLQGVVAGAESAPTDQAYAAFKDLSARLQTQLDRLDRIVKEEIPALNKQIKAQNLPAIVTGGTR